MKDRFTRLSFLIGDDKLELLKNKRVVVLGLGGVGGYVVESIVRCGIGSILLVDFDIIDITNINRQIIATEDNIGMKKTDALKERILSINPECKIEINSNFIDEDNYKDLFKGKIDYFIDCCDTLKTKENVIKYALEHDIKIISCMGAGARMNPEDLRIMDIKKTYNDPLARKIRKFLSDEKINKKLMVMCSIEKPVKVDKIIPSNSFVPASAGLLITSYVIKELIK